MDNHALPSILAHHGAHGRVHLAPTSGSCATGCAFGSDHPHATCQTASAQSSFEVLHTPWNIPSSPYHASDIPLADLVAQYGTASSTAWLDSAKYKLWRPSQPIPESTFQPVQGYIRKDPVIIAWGNPLVSSPAALEKTARAFIAFVEANHLRPIWSCVDANLEAILADTNIGWITVSCIYEDVLDPVHVIERLIPDPIDSERHGEREALSREPLRNLHQVHVEDVDVHEVRFGEWAEEERRQAEVGIRQWRAHKHRLDLESMSPHPWVDEQHRRYWIAKQVGKMVGIEILTRTGPLSWQIVESITFPHAPKGTFEMLIHAALRDLQSEQANIPEESTSPIEDANKRLRVSFGITAADHLTAGHNVSGWNVSVLSTTYHAVSAISGLIKLGKYRNKFDTLHEPIDLAVYSIILTPGLLEAFPAVGLQSARDCGILNVAQRLAILRLALSSWVSATLQEEVTVVMTRLSPSGKRALDNFIEEASEREKVPGFVLGISNLDDEICFQGGGTSIVGDASSGDVNPDSVFWICSQTKMITALAALKLIEQGKLAFDTELSEYLPEFKSPIIVQRTSTQKTAFKPASTAVKVRHLLNFSSGLFYPVVPGDLLGLCDGYTSKDMHAAEHPISAFFDVVKGQLPEVPLKFEPGTDFVYGWSSDILGFLVEKVSGQTLEQFCKEHIFDPLEMKTSFYLTQDLRQNLVKLAFRNEDGHLSPFVNQIKIIEQDGRKVRVHLGGVGLYSSMRDYLKLLRHLMKINAGHSVSGPILKTETVRSMFVPALTEKGSDSLSKFMMIEGTQWGTASALTTKDWPKKRRQGSAFWGGWAGTQHFMDPTTGIAVVLGVQVLPTLDLEVAELWSKLETLVYSAVEDRADRL